MTRRRTTLSGLPLSGPLVLGLAPGLVLAPALVLALGGAAACGGVTSSSAGPGDNHPGVSAPDAGPAGLDASGGTPGSGSADAGPDAPATPAPPLPVPHLGANVDATGVRFRVWAPHATAAWVTGDFPGGKAALAPVAGAIFEGHVDGAHAGNRYAFVFDSPSGSITRLDPYGRELLTDGCKVIDPNAYPWTTPAFTRPRTHASVVYEMHVASFTTDPAGPAGAHGTLASARPRLAALADLGVNVVELMPVHAFGGTNGWGYNPQLWLAPNPALGTSADLRAFVDEAHRLGIAVWIDFVVNHADGWKNAPLACFDGSCPNGASGVYFFGAGPYATTPWGPRPDYTQPEVATMLVASVEQ